MHVTLAERWQSVRASVDTACREAGRDPSEVTILPVSKTFGVAAIREAMALGLTRFGENRVQEVRAKQAELVGAGIDWVVIGHLQTNKAKDVARLASEVQSLDRLELAVALDQRLQHEGRAIDVLIEVKTSPEEAKHGLPPAALPSLLVQLKAMHSLRVQGLMTMAVHSDDAAAVRACFRQLRELRDAARDDGFALPRLSMGMSGDFALAIAEGATEVRIGRAIFGDRVATA
ncbi:MAG TPA: YggS family pyridoxal phosphate-dependent enzyme [Rhodanobacteraceae bacterium]